MKIQNHVQDTWGMGHLRACSFVTGGNQQVFRGDQNLVVYYNIVPLSINQKLAHVFHHDHLKRQEGQIYVCAVCQVSFTLTNMTSF